MGKLEIPNWTDFDTVGEAEYHDVTTISLYELADDGIVTIELFADSRIIWYSEEVRNRVWDKFLLRYGFQEIGILPPKRWMLRVVSKLAEVMPKYLPMYDAIERGQSYLVDGDEWHKGRDVHSTFPQTALGGSAQDYASYATDNEHETMRYMPLTEYAQKAVLYNDVDALILNELAPLFSALVTQNLNL